MATVSNSRALRVIPLLIAVCLVSFPAQAQYGGGTGEPNDPYLIYTAEQMNAIGLHEDDWEKHFKLMADIDLSSFTGKAFNIIGTYTSSHFSGVFDGNGHTISNLTYTSTDTDSIGIFGYVEGENALIKDIGLIDPNVDAGTGDYVGSLVGQLRNGTITDCYVEGGIISGNENIGGLVGAHGVAPALGSYDEPPFTISDCYSTATVFGGDRVGGLVGSNYNTPIDNCYATGSVTGNGSVGGLVGYNSWGGSVSKSYSTGTVSGHSAVGGLVGVNPGGVTDSYSTGAVSGDCFVGGLVGKNWYFVSWESTEYCGSVTNSYSTGPASGNEYIGGLVGNGVPYEVINSFWDTETSGQQTSDGGIGKITAEMHSAGTFIGWGGCENEGIWTIDEGKDYPRLRWENKPGEALDTQQVSDFLTGDGTKNDPYLIYTVEQINIIGVSPCDWDKHYRLMADIDLGALTGTNLNIIGISYDNAFTGVFDGNGHTISNFNYITTERNYLGVFGHVSGGAEIKDLGLIDTNIDAGTGNYVGSLVGRLSAGTITGCYVEDGSISGDMFLGGLVGYNWGGTITNCYSTVNVSGDFTVGGLVGENYHGTITNCYSTGRVSGDYRIGGLVGSNSDGTITGCFWDIEASGQVTSAGGAGETTAEMQISLTFFGWGGWGDEGNGLWTIDEGNDYPRLWWENAPGHVIEPTRQSLVYATNPEPLDGAINEDTCVSLSWLPGGYAVSHRVYFGDNFDDVNDGTGGTFRGNRNSTSYVVGLPGFAYPNGLIPGTTYYWRIDEINNKYPESPWKGDVWSFTIPHRIAFNPGPPDGVVYEDTWVCLSWSPGDYTVSHDVYFGDNFDDVDEGVESTFQGNQADTFFVAGFTGFPYPDGLVPGTTYYWKVDEVNDTEPNSPWKGDVWSFSISPKTAYFPDPADGAESVDTDITLSWTAGFGAKLHTVYFGENYYDVENAAEGLPQGNITYTPGPLKPGKTYYWRVDEFDIVETHKGDVWSFTTEGGVQSVNPSNGAVDVKRTVVLSWLPGDHAASHHIYFGTDKVRVRDADTISPEYKGDRAIGFESYDPGRLELDTTYYWRIDEVNDVNPESPWIGPVWSFTTANFLVVDDFESYNDLDPSDPDSNRIFNTWIDGYDIPTNGSDVGSTFPWYPKVHSGNQSMPFYYNNSVGYSEATANVDNLEISRDWTIEGVVVLSLWFNGRPYNAAERMYVALANANGPTAVVYHDNPNAAQIETWTDWKIYLQKFADEGVDLTNIDTISIGFGYKDNPVAGGSGEMWFDDIRLYRPAPQEPEPAP